MLPEADPLPDALAELLPLTEAEAETLPWASIAINWFSA